MKRKGMNTRPGRYSNRVRMREKAHCTPEVEEGLGEMVGNIRNAGVRWPPPTFLSNIPQERNELQPTTSQAASQMEGNTAFLGQTFFACGLHSKLTESLVT